MISSPLRYPGGKAKLFPFISKLIENNKLFGLEYCEPYAGGAGLAIRLLTSGFVERISINDIDCSIYAFWLSALRNTNTFCSLIENTPITIDEWHRQKKVWEQGMSKTALPSVLRLISSTELTAQVSSKVQVQSGVIRRPVSGSSMCGSLNESRSRVLKPYRDIADKWISATCMRLSFFEQPQRRTIH